MTQTTNHILMVRPVRFAFNEQTAENNAFQQKTEGNEDVVAQQAIKEFDAYVQLLRDNGVTVDVLQDTAVPPTPDSIFPNNCFSVHGDTLVIYPMFAPNRRLERAKLLTVIQEDQFKRVLHLEDLEEFGSALEGTGSLVLDREHRTAYACLSPRTQLNTLKLWASEMDYDYFAFHSRDKQGTPVYHTNVVMHIGTRQAVVCLDSIRDSAEREALVSRLEHDGKEVIPITLDQMNQFAGNMLELHNNRGEQLLVMSQTALHSLTPKQEAALSRYTRIVAPDINTIESVGGGSARCMIAELFYENNSNNK